MKSVLISIKPQWCEKIASGRKTIEVRKSAPKKVPFKNYIYESKNGGHRCKHCNEKDSCYSYAQKNVGCYNGRGRVIGEFVCDRVYKWECKNRLEILESFPTWRASYMLFVDDLEKTCLTYDDLWDYGKGKPLYGWHISDLVIYDKPKELSEFGRKCDYASEIHCRDCLILGDWDSCCGVMCKPLTRPPQSYMYVEEI